MVVPIKLKRKYVKGNEYPKQHAGSNISGGRKKNRGNPAWSVKNDTPPKVMVMDGLTGATRMRQP